MTSKFKFDPIRPTYFGGAQTFCFYELFDLGTLSASKIDFICEKILYTFCNFVSLLKLCQIKKNFVKTRHRPFEQSLFLFSSHVGKWRIYIGAQKWENAVVSHFLSHFFSFVGDLWESVISAPSFRFLFKNSRIYIYSQLEFGGKREWEKNFFVGRISRGGRN